MNEETKIIIAILVAGAAGYYLGKRSQQTIIVTPGIPSTGTSAGGATQQGTPQGGTSSNQYATTGPNPVIYVTYQIPASWSDVKAESTIAGYYGLHPTPSTTSIQGFLNDQIRTGAARNFEYAYSLQS